MRNKRSLLVLLSLVLVLAMSSNVFAASFNDTGNHWAKASIDWAAGIDLVVGEADGNFRPDDPISKAEFYTIVNRFIGAKNTSTVTYSDVKSTDWYYNEVAKAINAGYITADKGGLGAEDYITRGSVAQVFAKIYNLSSNDSAAKKFKDYSDFPATQVGAIGALADKGIINGFEDGYYKAAAHITRGEMTKIFKSANDIIGRAFAGQGGTSSGTPSADGMWEYKGKKYTYDEFVKVFNQDYGNVNNSGNNPSTGAGYGDNRVDFDIYDKYDSRVSNPSITVYTRNNGSISVRDGSIKLAEGTYYFEVYKSDFETFRGAFNVNRNGHTIKVKLLPTGSSYSTWDNEYYVGNWNWNNNWNDGKWGTEKITVYYEDQNGREIDRETLYGNVGDTVRVEARVFRDYYLRDDKVKTVRVTSGSNSVTFRYTYDRNWDNGRDPWDWDWGYDKTYTYRRNSIDASSTDLQRALEWDYNGVTRWDLSEYRSYNGAEYYVYAYDRGNSRSIAIKVTNDFR